MGSQRVGHDWVTLTLIFREHFSFLLLLFSCVWLFVIWQHTKLPCPSPSPGACSNSCPLSQLYHLTISSSVVSFFSCLQSFPTSGSFQKSQLFASGGQSIGALASASVLPGNIQDWFALGWTGWISLQRSSRLDLAWTLESLFQHHSSKASILWPSAFFIIQLSHLYTTTGKTVALTRWTFVGKVMSLLFNILSRLTFPHSSVGKASACNAGDPGLIPGSEGPLEKG